MEFVVSLGYIPFGHGFFLFLCLLDFKLACGLFWTFLMSMLADFGFFLWLHTRRKSHWIYFAILELVIMAWTIWAAWIIVAGGNIQCDLAPGRPHESITLYPSIAMRLLETFLISIARHLKN